MSARKITIDGITFDSLMEGRRYRELKLLERAGVIVNLACHTKYMLQEKFSLPNGKKIRAITWTDDFSYDDLERAEHVVEDVKGVATEANRLRIKMFMKRYRQDAVLIREV